MKKDEKAVYVPVRITAEQHLFLKYLAETTGCTTSAAMRLIIELYMKKLDY